MATTTSHARRDRDGGVVTVTFTRDDKLNAVDSEMMAVLQEAARELADDDSVRVLVITAEGRYFTAGIDIGRLQEEIGRASGDDAPGSNRRRRYRTEALHDFYDFLESIEKPIVLAAQGPCLGIGIEMGSSCDFRLAAAWATFALPEVPNLAMIPGSGGISRLTRLVGPHWAKWLAMAGQTVDADTARVMGLVHAIYPDDEFAERVTAFAHRLAGLPREAMGLSKIAIDNSVGADRRTARDVDRLIQTLLATGPEHLDLVEAFTRGGRKA